MRVKKAGTPTGLGLLDAKPSVLRCPLEWSDETNTAFTAPHDKRTQDYVTGRFG